MVSTKELNYEQKCFRIGHQICAQSEIAANAYHKSIETELPEEEQVQNSFFLEAVTKMTTLINANKSCLSQEDLDRSKDLLLEARTFYLKRDTDNLSMAFIILSDLFNGEEPITLKEARERGMM